MIDLGLLGSHIRDLRKCRGLTQNEFANVLSVSFQAVSNWERGIAPPDIGNLVRISKFFGVSLDTLLASDGEDLFLGIDGGGTKTELAVVSVSGHVFKRTVTSGSNPNDIGYERAEKLICDEIRNILSEYPSVRTAFCGIAGMTTGDYSKKLQASIKKLFPQLQAEINTDAFNLFALDDNASMALISGTGSVLFIKDRDRYKRLGGWGYLFDSNGSAYDIGKNAIRHALEEEDTLTEPSPLSRMLLQKMNSKTVWEHVNSLYLGGRSYIAGFATTVFEAYRLGDETAIGIIDDTAIALAKLLNKAVSLYGVTPIAVASGGLFEHHSDILSKHIAKYSNAKLCISDLPPIYGACKSACLMTGAEISDGFYENFKSTYRRIDV